MDTKIVLTIEIRSSLFEGIAEKQQCNPHGFKTKSVPRKRATGQDRKREKASLKVGRILGDGNLYTDEQILDQYHRVRHVHKMYHAEAIRYLAERFMTTYGVIAVMLGGKV